MAPVFSKQSVSKGNLATFPNIEVYIKKVFKYTVLRELLKHGLG